MNQTDRKAVVHYGGDDFFVAISASGHSLVLDTGENRSTAPSPMELLLLGLGGCTGSDVISILRKKRERVTAYRVEIHHVIHGHNISESSVA